MPLPPVAPNATDRYFIDYFTANGQSTMLVRLRGDLRGAAAEGIIRGLVNVYRPLAPAGTLFADVRFSAAGSTVSLPSFSINLNGTGGTGPVNEDLTRFITFVGRSTTGRRVRQTLFVPVVGPDVDYLIPIGTDPLVDAVINYLRANTSSFVGADGQPVGQWYGYANTGFNAYYQRRARRVR